VATNVFTPVVVKVKEQLPVLTVAVQSILPSLTVTLPVGIPPMEVTLYDILTSCHTVDGFGECQVMMMSVSAVTFCDTPADSLLLK
jgi:hypothetical protein